MALIKLRAAGHEDVAVFEKADSLGGTWRDNRYPGLTCDVASLAYRYSFAPWAEWSRACAPAAEILAYLKAVAAQYDAERSIRYGEEITQAVWEDDGWTLASGRERGMRFDAVITATGILHHPVTPEIEGLEMFAGAAFHSARWPEGVETAGRRVGIVGTGSTATHMVAALVDTVETVTLFQRTAQWVLPLPNPEYGEEERAAFRDEPGLLEAEYDRINAEQTSKFAAAVVGENPHTLGTIARMCREHLATVRDVELRRRLTPDYPVGCKRLIMSEGFYDAIQRPNARLVTEAIARVEPEGVRTADGELHALDVLVLATGFDTHRFFRPMRVVGRGGRTLEDAWAEENASYLGVVTPGLPNWFMIGGPHSPIGNFSWLLTAEAQFGYIAQLIERLAEGAASVEPTAEAAQGFREAVRAQLPRTVWAQGCRSWYMDRHGNVASWPWTYDRFLADMAAPRMGDFLVTAG